MTFGGDPAVAARARELAALARASAEETERERRLPAPLAEAMREAGLFHLWTPRELGGLDADAATFMDAVLALSEGDAAAGWVAMIAAETAALAAFMPREAAARVFGGGGRAILVGTLQPPAGTLRPLAGGGHEAEGRWPFASGLPHADWLISRARLLGADGEPALDERGQPRLLAFAVPAAEAEAIDTWTAPGLLGTGSHDYAMRGVRVEDGLAFALGPPWSGGPRAALPIQPHFQMGHGAHAIGVARQAIAAFADIAARPAWSARPAEEIALAHRARGEAEALAASSEAWLARLIGAIGERGAAGEPHPPEALRELTLAVAHAVRSCVRAADLLFEAAGAQALYRPNRLERAWRDLRAAGQHLHAKPRHYAAAGRALLEAPPA